MKMSTILVKTACSLGLLSVVSAAHAQGQWTMLSIMPVKGYPAVTLTAVGPGTATASGSVTFAHGNTVLTLSAGAVASGTGGVGTSSLGSYQVSELITYQWSGTGPQTTYFNSVVEPYGIASFGDSDGIYERGGSGGGGSVGPISAAVSLSFYRPGSGLNAPGPTTYQFAVGGVSNPSWTATASADAGGNIISPLPSSSTGSYSGSGNGSIIVNAPYPN